MFLCDQFWNRWRKHYLATIQSRSKWRRSSTNVCVGDFVLVKRNTKRNEWPMGRVTATRISRDGLVRSAVVQLSKKDLEGHRSLERAVRDLVVLHSTQESTSQLS